MGRKKEMISFNGDRLKQVLDEQGMNYSQLAEQMGYVRQTAGNWARKNEINYQDLLKVSEILHVSPRYFTNETDDKDEIIIDNDGDYIFMNDFKAFDLLGNSKELNKYLEEKKQNALKNGGIQTENDYLARIQKERTTSLIKFKELLNTPYFRAYWKPIESDEQLSELMEVLRRYIEEKGRMVIK